MKVLDKIKINNIEYDCIQKLCIEDKIIYKIYSSERNESHFIVENEKCYEFVKDKELLSKIEKITNPETDIIINKEV